jgi:outer membrane protein TolC
VEQAKANMDLGKANATALDVFRAETQLYQTVQRLVDGEAAMAAELDGLKIDLALPVDEPIAIDQSRPEVVLFTVDAARAIALALTERTDLATAYDAIEDSDRQVEIARRNMLPQLDATAGATWNGTLDGQGGESFGRAPGWAVGMRMALPLDRHNERFAYDQVLIQRQQTARNAEIKRSQVIQEVQKALQDLRSAEATLSIQDRNRKQARLKFEKANLDLNAGDVGNREVVEAQNELVAAENAFFQAKAAYQAAELSLRHAVGVLNVAEDGRWDATPPAYASARNLQERP